MSNAHVFLNGLAAFGGIVGLISTMVVPGLIMDAAVRREEDRS